MNIKPWKILCFLLVIVVATIAVHPTQRDILRGYIENGRYASAWTMIEKLLAESPLDLFLNKEASRLELFEGNPDKAIDRLESVHRQSPLPPDQLERLAVLYEWNRQPRKALNTWERLLKEDPRNQTALARLIGYYRYQGNLAGESRAIVGLIRLQEADGKWQKHGKRLSNLIADQLNRIDMPATPKPVDPLIAMLASGLYQIYEKELDLTKDNDPFVTENIYRCLEQFVWTGHLALGQAFAERADLFWQTGIDQELRMVEVLRWNKMDQEALDLLARLHDKVPQDRRVLMAMAQIADSMADPSASIALYKTLAHMDPAEPVYQRRLMALYLQTGRTTELFKEYENRYTTTKDPQVVEEFLTIAIQSGDPNFQKHALAFASQTDADTPGCLKLRADLYLALDQPENAYPLLKRLATAPGSMTEEFESMIQVAGYTDNPITIADALNTAKRERPDDPAILNLIASRWLTAGQPEKAYQTMRHLTAMTGNRPVDIRETLDMAWHTGDPRLIKEAVTWALELSPNDRQVIDRAVRLCLSVDQVPKAIDALERYLKIRPEDQKARMQLARLYEWQNQPQKALALYRRILRETPNNKGAAKALARLTGSPAATQEDLDLAKKRSDADPQNFALALAAGRALVAEEQLQEGAIYLRRAADLNPNDNAVWRELADVYEWTGQTNRLIEALEHLADGGSLNRRHRLLLAEVYMRRRHWSQAGALLQPVTEEAVVPRREGLMLVEVYANMDRNQDAENLIRRLELENKGDPGFLADLGQQAQWRQLSELALDIYESVLRQDPENLKALKGCGQIYSWTARPTPAIRFLKTYNRLSPEDHETRYLLGEIYLAVHRDAEAQKEFRMAKRLINTAKAKNGLAVEPSVRKGAWP